MFVVDTNVFVYAANRAAPEHARCARLVEEWRGGALPWFTTWGVLYEFLRVTTHARVMEHPIAPRNAWAFVQSVLRSPGLQLLVETERHAAVVHRTLDDLPFLKGNQMHDAHTAILMREHGIRQIYTRDADFYRFPFLEVVDPLLGDG